MIKGLHHNAYRCRDSEETRRFYEDFLGLPLAGTLEIHETKTGRADAACCTRSTRWTTARFSRSSRRRTMPFEFKAQHDYDLHIALEVDAPTLADMFAKGKARGIETRGISDHGFIRSIYFRDPNGYVIELTAKTAAHAAEMDPAKKRRAREARALATREDRARARLTYTVRPGSRVPCGLRSVGEIRDAETSAALRRLGPVAPRSAGAVLLASRR